MEYFGNKEFDKYFVGILATNAARFGGVGEVSKFLSELKGGGSSDDLQATKVGEVLSEKMGISDLRNKSAIIKALEQNPIKETKHSGGNVKAMTPTRFRQDEGLIYAPSGNAFVMAASLMNNNGMNYGSNNDRGNIYLDGEKVGRVLLATIMMFHDNKQYFLSSPYIY